jgi:hypothetical protein
MYRSGADAARGERNIQNKPKPETSHGIAAPAVLAG